MSNYKPILIVPGEPNSIFSEIFFKTLKKEKYKSPLIVIGSYKVLFLQMKKLKFRKKFFKIDLNNINLNKINNKSINIIDVNYKQSRAFNKISNKSKNYINKCYQIALNLIKQGFSNKLLTGPISKKNFLNQKHLGITEYLADQTKTSKVAMLIYNEKLSVCPITTHLPLKFVTKKINKKIIVEKVKLINNFYLSRFKIKPRIGILGLNPHCESRHRYNEDKKIIKPAINFLKTINNKISGPFSADTCFMKSNRKKYDVIVGMYHDQVLTPMKTLLEYDAINITLGLPLIRVSPDHGPNEKMLGKNKSNPESLKKAIKFLDKN